MIVERRACAARAAAICSRPVTSTRNVSPTTANVTTAMLLGDVGPLPQPAIDTPTANEAAVRVLFAMSRFLTECECEDLDPWIEELDLEQLIRGWLRLSNELIQARLARDSVTALVNVGALRGARVVPPGRHSKSDWRGAPRRAHHEVQIARVKGERDPAAG